MKKNYSVFFVGGDEANDHYLSEREAYELASKLDSEGYEIIVCKLVRNKWEECPLPKDRNGKIIMKNSVVAWWDWDQEVFRGPYKVYKIHDEDMVCLSNDFSEAECPPCELVVIPKKTKDLKEVITTCPYCESEHIRLDKDAHREQEDDECVDSYFCKHCKEHFGIEKPTECK